MSYTASYIVNSSSAQGTTDFTFTFPYIKEEHIEVYYNYQKLSQGTGTQVINGVTYPQFQVITTSPTKIRLATGTTSANLRVEIRRNSSLDEPLVDYADGSTLTANDLDTSALQSLYIDQELKDNQGKTVSVDEDTGLPSMGESSAGNLRLTKVADPTAAQDAATKNYVDTKDALQVTKAGDSMTGALAMGTNKVTGVGDPTAAQDAATKNYVDTKVFSSGQLSNVVVTTTNITDGTIVAGDLATGTLDGRYYTETELDAGQLDNRYYTETELNAGQLDNRYFTETELTGGALDGRYFTETEADARYFNISSGETIKDGDAFPDNDTTIATTAAINDRIIDLVDDVGGFVPIANETSFPTTNPDVNNGTGTLVSIKEFASSHTPSGGTVTIANGAGSGNTVTITGCGSTVLTAGFGGIVETTSTLHTYTFHRLSPKATEVTTVAGISGNITTVAGIAANVTTVAGISANVTTVAANNTNVTNVGGSIANVNTVATNISGINDFAARYRVASSDPTSNNDEGDLVFNTTSNELRVYNGSTWQGGVTATGNLLSKSGDTMTGNLAIDNAKEIRLSETDANGSNYLGFKAPDSVTANVTFTLPDGAGSANQYLKTAGNGTLSWSSISTDLSGDTSPQLGGNLDVNSKNIILSDSSDGTTTDVIKIGDGAGGVPDLSIYSNGTEGILQTQDGGTIKIKDGNNTMATFSGASNQIDFGVHCTWQGASSNAAWDKANSRFSGTITEINVTANNSTDETVYPLFADGATGSQGAETDTGLTYNPSSGLLTSTGFSGSGANLTSLPAGELTGTVADARISTLTASKLTGALPSISGANLTNLPATGGVVTGTASGTLPNGRAVKVNTNGTFSIAALAPPSFGGGGISSVTTAIDSAEGCYIGNNRFLFCYYSSAHTQARAIIGEVNSNGTMTWGTPVVPQTWSNSVSCIAWNHDDEMGIYNSNQGSGWNNWSIQFTVSGLVPTFGTTRGASISPQDSFKGCLVYGHQNKYMFGYIAYSQFRWVKLSNNTSGVNNAPSLVNGSSYSSGTMYENAKISGCWNSDINTWTMFYDRNHYLSAHQFIPSGSSISASTTHPSSVSGYLGSSHYYSNSQVVYDSVNDKYLFGWADSSWRQKLKAATWNNSSYSWSQGSEVNVTDSNDSNESTIFQYNENPWICWNSTSEEFTVVWGSSGNIKGKDVTISGTTITLSSTYSYSTTIYTSSSSQAFYLLTSTDSSRWMLMYHSSSTASKAVSRQGTSTTISNDNYVGFSDGTYSNGQTATIQLPGTVVDGLSGLTTGSKYYVSGDGTVSLTDTYYTNITAGVALSSSTLLLK